MKSLNSEGKEDAIWALAKNIVDTSYEDLPPRVIEATKNGILDTIGVIEGASGTTPVIQGLIDLVKEGGGKEESTILGFGGKVPAWMAAFANGAMAHCLDYDDSEPLLGHPSAATVPAGLAVAERLGMVNGKDVITAVALGKDLFSRLCYSVRKGGWANNPLFSYFAAAATSGKLLRLSEEQMVDALGLAFFQAAGTREMAAGDSELRGMREAFPSKAGVISALLAQRGVRGIRTCLEGKEGLYNVYYGGVYDKKALITDLGKQFLGASTRLKPWPACGMIHSYVDATLTVVKENNITPKDVDKIEVFVADDRLEHFREDNRFPATVMNAKLSIPFTLGIAVARRKVVIDDYSVEGLKDQVVLDLARKVTSKLDEKYSVSASHGAGKIEVRTKDGKTYPKHVDFPYGHPKKPLSMDDLANKFVDCVSHAAKPVSKNNTDKVIRMISHLEDVDDIRRIIILLA